MELVMSTSDNKNSEDEEPMRANSHVISYLTREKSELSDKIEDLKKRSAERESEFSVLRDELTKTKDEDSAQILAFGEKIKNLQYDLVSLQNEKQELAQQCEKLKLDLDSMHSQKSELEKQLRAKDHEVDNIKQKSSEDQEQIKANSDEISQLGQEKLELLNKIDELEKRFAKSQSEFCALQDKHIKIKEESEAQIRALAEDMNNVYIKMGSVQDEKVTIALQCEKLKLDLDSIHSQKSEVEKQLRAKDHEVDTRKQKSSKDQEQIKANSDEISQLRQEKSELLNKIDEWEKSFAMSQSEFCALWEKHIEIKEEGENAYQKLNEEYKEIDRLYNECNVKLWAAEKKIAQMAEELNEGIGSKEQMVADFERTVEVLKRDLEEKGDEISSSLENARMLEVKLRLSNQKLRVTEQVLSEKEETLKKTEEKFQQDQKELEDRIATLSATITANNEAFHETITNIKECVNSVTTDIDTVTQKFSDSCENYDSCISNISQGLQVAKDSVREINREKEQLKEDKNHLMEELQGKREHELTLREKVEKLEANARKEESENMNLTTTVGELKKTVGELEKIIKEKEEGILELGEEKREAIRQLCLWIEYHRDRYDYLKDVISKTRTGQRSS